jgi:hypothetical protein
MINNLLLNFAHGTFLKENRTMQSKSKNIFLPRSCNHIFNF